MNFGSLSVLRLESHLHVAAPPSLHRLFD